MGQLGRFGLGYEIASRNAGGRETASMPHAVKCIRNASIVNTYERERRECRGNETPVVPSAKG